MEMVSFRISFSFTQYQVDCHIAKHSCSEIVHLKWTLLLEINFLRMSCEYDVMEAGKKKSKLM